MQGRMPKLVAAAGLILLAGLVAFLAMRSKGRGPGPAPPVVPASDGPEAKVAVAPPTVRPPEPERPVVAHKPRPAEAKHSGGELLVQMVGRRVVVSGQPQANLRCQPIEVMPMLFAVIFGPNLEAQEFRVPGDADVSKAITVRVLQRTEDGGWGPLGVEARAVRRRRDGAGEFLAGGDTVYMLYELSVREPVVIRVEATLECERLAPGWRARVTALGEPVEVRQAAEWEVYEALKEQVDALEMVGDQQAAERTLEEMTRRWPGLPMPMVELAGRRLQQGRIAEAEELAQRAMRAVETLAAPEQDPVLGAQWEAVTDPAERRRAAEEFKSRRAQEIRALLETIRSRKD